MSTIDELGRNAATALRTRMESTIDVDDGLRSMGDMPLAPAIPSPSRHPRRAWLVGTAAAAVIAIGVGLVVTDDDEATTPGTNDTATETLAPTVASTESTPDTTPVAPPASTVEPATTTTVLLASDAALVVPDVGQLLPAPIDPCTPQENGTPCNFPLLSADGVVVALTGPADMTITAPDGSSRIQPLDRPAHGPLVALGPEGDVAYVLTDGGGGRGQLVAFSIAGDTQGEVIAESEPNLAMLGTDTFVATPGGIVQVLESSTGRRPASDVEPALPWLRYDGSETTHPGPFTSFDPESNTVTLTDADDVTVGAWTIPDEYDVAGVPEVMFDGHDGAIVIGHDLHEHFVLRLRAGAAAQQITIPDGFMPAGRWGPTPVLYDGTDYWMWTVPGYTEVTAMEPIGLFGGTYGSANEALDSVITELTTGDGCEVRPTAIVTQRSGDNPVHAVIEFTSLCDDSVVGGTYDVTVIGLTGAWEFVSVSGRGLCARGPATDPRFCV